MTDHADSPLAVRLTRRLEDDERLEPLAGLLAPLADALSRSPALVAQLQGREAGHAAHPFLTDLPLGAWTSATILDLVGGPGSRGRAQRQ